MVKWIERLHPRRRNGQFGESGGSDVQASSTEHHRANFGPINDESALKLSRTYMELQGHAATERLLGSTSGGLAREMNDIKDALEEAGYDPESGRKRKRG